MKEVEGLNGLRATIFSFIPQSRLLQTRHPKPAPKILLEHDRRCLCGLELGLTLHFGLCSCKQRQSAILFAIFFLLGKCFRNQTKVFFTREQHVDHDEDPPSHQTKCANKQGRHYLS